MPPAVTRITRVAMGPSLPFVCIYSVVTGFGVWLIIACLLLLLLFWNIFLFFGFFLPGFSLQSGPGGCCTWPSTAWRPGRR